MPLPNFPAKSFKASSTRIYEYYDVPPQGSHRGTILFMHGFPDAKLTWTALIKHFSSKGFRCIAPDLLGFGDTSRPKDLAEYSFQSMSEDLSHLVKNAVGDEKVIVVSHDWGAGLAWRFTQYHQDLIKGMCAVCVPYFAMHDQWIPREVITAIVPSFGYQAFFEDPKSTDIIQDNIEKFLRGALSSPGLFTRSKDAKTDEEDKPTPEKEGILESMLTDTNQQPPSSAKLMFDKDVFEKYLKSFAAPEKGGKGMEGGLNWYRTRRINFEDELKVKNKKYPSTFPVLLVVPELDAALPPMLFKDTTKHLDAKQLERADIPDCGHFVQLEKPDLLIQALEGWFVRRGLVDQRDSKL